MKVLLYLLIYLIKIDAYEDLNQNNFYSTYINNFIELYDNKKWVKQEFINAYIIRSFNYSTNFSLENRKYLHISKKWTELQIENQSHMFPKGAYYMGYHRKPYEKNGQMYIADGAVIAMAILSMATHAKNSIDKEKYMESVKKFSDMVILKYVKPSGGVANGIWKKSKNEWWCSTALFSELTYRLYGATGERKYLKIANNAMDWLLNFDYYKSTTPNLTNKGGDISNVL